MTVYYVTILLLILFGSLAQKNDYQMSDELSFGRIEHTRNAKWFFFLAAALLIFVAGFRYKVGTDFGSYYHEYKTVYANYFFENLKHLSEPGYGFISLIATKIHDDGATAIFLASFVTIALYLRTIYRNTDCLFIALLLFVFLECWQESFNAVRQCLAAAVIFTGFESLRDRKFWRYSITVFIAFLFHKSAVVLILPYFFVHRRSTKGYFVLLLLGAFVTTFAYDRLFYFSETVLNDYTVHNSYVTSAVNLLRILAMCAPAVFFAIHEWQNGIDEKNSFYLNLLIINAAVSIASSASTYLARMTIYTAPFTAIAISELLKTLPQNRRKIYSFLIPFLYCIFCLYDISINPSMNNFIWIWQR